MGSFEHRIGIHNGNGGDARTVSALVDTGAAYSIMPATLLQELGIEATRRERFTFANEDEATLPVGHAFFEVGGKEAPSPVVFGSENTYIFGATSLQALGLIADTTNHTLIPAPRLHL